jgi:hypothetical protein
MLEAKKNSLSLILAYEKIPSTQSSNECEIDGPGSNESAVNQVRYKRRPPLAQTT